LHSHLGLTFLTAHNDRILFFEKATPSRENVVLVAISLDPFQPQEADIELPARAFEHWRMQEWDALAVTDLVTGARQEWRGRRQHVRIEPERPFAIWRIAPAAGLPFDERAHTALGHPSPAGQTAQAAHAAYGASETHHEA
jgi:starch synthase (maltosyl-transferring)